MAESDAVTRARHALGEQLAAARTAAGHGQHGLAPLTGYSRSTLANVETGRQHVQRDFWERCDAALGTGGALAAGFDRLEVLIRAEKDGEARRARAEREDRVRRHRATPRRAQALPGRQGGAVPAGPLVSPGLAGPGEAVVAPHPGRELVCPPGQAAQPAHDLLLLDEWPAMHRRDLAGAAAAGALAHLEHYLSVFGTDPAAKVAAVRALVTAQRRREGSVPARDLAGTVAAHLRLLRDLGITQPDPAARREAAEALGEGLGFLAWLAWDMGEIGSAGRFYQAATRLARQSGHPTLVAGYMLGSLAAFAATTGSAHRGLLLADTARRALPASRHPAVDAWLEATAALTHAAAGDADQAWRCLDQAEHACASARPGDEPPWPWVMRFDAAKLAGYRLSAAVALGDPDRALGLAPAATAPPARTHTTRYALTLLDVASAHGMKADYDRGAAVALAALDAAAAKHSHRVLRAAWQARQAIPASVTSDPVRRLDARLRDLDPVDL